MNEGWNTQSDLLDSKKDAPMAIVCDVIVTAGDRSLAYNQNAHTAAAMKQLNSVKRSNAWKYCDATNTQVSMARGEDVSVTMTVILE